MTNVPYVQQSVEDIEDYSKVLEKFLIHYGTSGYYLQVGKITKVQGWILHISVVRWQIPELLDVLLPFIISTQTPFKVIKDKNTARQLLDGNLGLHQVGKVVSIYPETDDFAASLAKELIALTKPFKGPVIRTDVHLGTNVYTRYGSFNPIIHADQRGQSTNFIYNNTGELVPDTYSMPFTLPVGIDWPFSTFASSQALPKKKILNGTYKPITILKSDAKGDVLKALYTKGLFRIGWCIIKEGKENMWSDRPGSDMPERLLWQKEIHDNLHHKILIPKIFDLFYDDGNAYLVMEYIKGTSLLNKVLDLNTDYVTWDALPIKKRLNILDYLQQVIIIINKLHESGYVHRDVTPVNFIVNKKNKIYAIDNELAFSLDAKKPNPPFLLGSDGFMSPEQIAVQLPSPKEDIYGLGASMIMIFTGFHPLVFSNLDADTLRQHLYFFLSDSELVDTICACLNSNPLLRPSLSLVQNNIIKHESQLLQGLFSETKQLAVKKISNESLLEIINYSINGLVSPPTLIIDDIWLSKAAPKENVNGRETESFCPAGGLYEGISGVLYFLAKAKINGFDISQCERSYKKSWEYLQYNFLNQLTNINPGLYGGSAGFAIALSWGIKGNLIEDHPTNRSIIYHCLEVPTNDLNLVCGVAGHGLALLQCIDFYDGNAFKESLGKYIDTLLAQLLKDKKKRLDIMSGKGEGFAGFSYGGGGILYFLLESLRYSKDPKIEELVSHLLKGIDKRAKALHFTLRKDGLGRILRENLAMFDEIKGILLAYIKAHEVLEDAAYKKSAEDILSNFSPFISYGDFSQEFGLPDLGEIYLEAYTKFKSEEWLNRANWILQILINTSNKNLNDSYYWLNKNSNYVTADFIAGNSGVIHFLMRFFMPDKIGYRAIH